MTWLGQKTDQLYSFFQKNKNEPIVQVHQSYLNDTILLAVRILGFFYLTVIYIWALYHTEIINNFIFLTYVGFFISWFFFTLVLQNYLPSYQRICGITSSNLKNTVEAAFELAISLELPITIIYWGFFFGQSLTNRATSTQIALSANLLGGALLILLIDVFFNSFPFPWRHLINVVIVMIWYLLINIIYSLTVRIIFTPLDWVTGISYGMAIACIILTILMFFLTQLFYKYCKIQRLSGILKPQNQVQIKKSIQAINIQQRSNQQIQS